MKKAILCLIMVLSTTLLFSQEKSKLNFSKEIDQQVWKKFEKAFNSRDAKKYNELHTDDIVRITKNGIRQGKVFRESVIKSYGKKDQPKREIEFKFEHRIHAENIAYEVGYFKVIYYRAEGEKTYYGRFSVVLKKVNNTWKIAQDWDINQINGVPITAEDYNKLK